MDAKDTQNDAEYVEYVYEMMSDQEILVTYLGDITPDITNALLKGVKNDRTHFDKEVGIQKKVYNIIVECLENIYRHNEVIEKTNHPSIFILGKSEDSYYIVTGNYIYNNQTDQIRSTLDQINSLNKDEIKKVYRETLSEGNLSDKGGAGLGIFDIAIKSGNKLEYDFIPVENDISFYILKAQVAKQQ